MKYGVIDYFDVLGNVEDGWVVNDICRTDYYIELSESDSNCDIIRKLIECEYLNDHVTLNDLEIEWLDSDLIEISEKELLYPICRLERIYEN